MIAAFRPRPSLAHLAAVMLGAACAGMSACKTKFQVDDSGRPPDDTAPGDTGVDTADTSLATLPPCRNPGPFVTFSRDEGATLAEVTGEPEINAYTWDIGFLDPGGLELVAEHGGRWMRSHDAGCTWTDEGPAPGPWVRFAAPVDGVLWGYQDNGPALVRVEASGWTAFEPGGLLLGLGVDPTDSDHLVVGTFGGERHETWNGGEDWTTRVLPVATSKPIVWRWSFHPQDLDIGWVGSYDAAVQRTDDGGQTWTTAAGFGERVNIYSMAAAPSDPDVLWVQGRDLDEFDSGAANWGAHLWRSEDGGRSFTPAVEQSGEVVLSNGVPLVVDPEDAGVAYFAWGSTMTGSYLYRHDAAGGSTTSTHTDWHRLMALAFSPADPDLLYASVVLEAVH